jgi:membrane protein YqaA with SNARE-associated domain
MAPGLRAPPPSATEGGGALPVTEAAPRPGVLDRLYARAIALARHRHALGWLAVVAFVESSVFPIPPDVMLIPMVLAERRKAALIAAVCTAASVIGGLAGYAIGYGLWEAVGQPLIDFYGYGEQMAAFTARYNDWGAWIVFTAGLTPFPYKVITIASGVAALDPVVFVIASALSRGLRFFVIAALLYRFGAPIERFIARNLGVLTVVFVVLLFAGYLVIKLWQ